MFTSSASAFDPTNLQRLKNTKICELCNLEGVDLRSANLAGANIDTSNLAGADLSGANLIRANLALAILNRAILCNTTMPDGSVNYRGC